MQCLAESAEGFRSRMAVALDDEVLLVVAEDAPDRNHPESKAAEPVGEMGIGEVPQEHRELRSKTLAGQLRRPGDDLDVEFALGLLARTAQPQKRLQESLRRSGLAQKHHQILASRAPEGPEVADPTLAQGIGRAALIPDRPPCGAPDVARMSEVDDVLGPIGKLALQAIRLQGAQHLMRAVAVETRIDHPPTAQGGEDGGQGLVVLDSLTEGEGTAEEDHRRPFSLPPGSPTQSTFVDVVVDFVGHLSIHPVGGMDTNARCRCIPQIDVRAAVVGRAIFGQDEVAPFSPGSLPARQYQRDRQTCRGGEQGHECKSDVLYSHRLDPWTSTRGVPADRPLIGEPRRTGNRPASQNSLDASRSCIERETRPSKRRRK